MELPEVEVVRRDLERDVVGRRIAAVEVRRMKNTKRVIRRHKTPKEFRDRLLGHKVTRAERKGKYILLQLDDGNVLVVHFGMTGRFLRGNKRLAFDNHTHVIITFQTGGDLRFVDPRTFGEMFVTAADDLGKVKELAHLAIDPLESMFTWQQFSGALANRASKLK
ncbi:MAG: DNA-formamidopyrimidine glycosylase family protein, partial [Actinomycetota bacterium]